MPYLGFIPVGMHAHDCMCVACIGDGAEIEMTGSTSYDRFLGSRKTDCHCDCHYGDSKFTNCGITCCRQYKPCKCLCHTATLISCMTSGGSSRMPPCCKWPRDFGQMGYGPHLVDSEDGDENVWPWRMPISARMADKRGRNYVKLEDMHLKMSIRGEDMNIDMFHLILHHVDKDYPVKPTFHINDELDVCKKCDGVLLHNVILAPRDYIRAAKQAGVEVKVHMWKKGKKCNAGVVRKQWQSCFE